MIEVPGLPVVVGYPYSLRINSSTAVFPAGATFTAQVRDVATDTLLTTLTTANGKLVAVDNFNMDVLLAGTDSVGWTADRVIFDIVRTDVNPDTYLGFKITLFVEQPVTRGL